MNLTVEKRTEVFVKLLNNFILEEKNMESTDKGKQEMKGKNNWEQEEESDSSKSERGQRGGNIE